MTTRDYALTEEHAGIVVVHRADCVYVRLLAELGYPVATLLGCTAAPAADLPRHECLKGES